MFHIISQITGIDLKYVPVPSENKALVKELSIPPPGAKDLRFPMQYSQSTWGQFKLILWKQQWTYWRNPDYNLSRFFFTLAAALIVGTIFWRVGTKRFISNSQNLSENSVTGPHKNDLLPAFSSHFLGKTAMIL